MTKPSIDPGPVNDVAPTVDGLTDYNRLHLVTYLRLLDADAVGADPEEVMREVLGIDPAHEPERARWMTRVGYRHILTDEKLDRPDRIN